MVKAVNFDDIRSGLIKLAESQEHLSDACLAGSLGELAHKASRLRFTQESAAAEAEQRKSGETYDEFGNAIVTFLKAYKGNPVIWSVIDNYLERNPELFDRHHRAGFNRWVKQAEDDPNIYYHYDPDTRVESWAWRPAGDNSIVSGAVESALPEDSSVDSTEAAAPDTDPEPSKKTEKLSPLSCEQDSSDGHTLYDGSPDSDSMPTDMPVRYSYLEKEELIHILIPPVENLANPVATQLTDWGLQIIKYTDGRATFSIEPDTNGYSERALYPLVIEILGQSKEPMSVEDMCRAFANEKGLEYNLFTVGNDEKSEEAKRVQEAIRSIVRKAVRVLKTKLADCYLSEKLQEDITYIGGSGSIRKKRVTYQLEGVLDS